MDVLKRSLIYFFLYRKMCELEGALLLTSTILSGGAIIQHVQQFSFIIIFSSAARTVAQWQKRCSEIVVACSSHGTGFAVALLFEA